MATQIEKNTEKLIQRKLDILFAKQQQLNNNAGGEQQQQYYAGGYLPRYHYGGGVPHSHSGGQSDIGINMNSPYQVDWNLPQVNTGNPDWYKPYNRSQFIPSGTQGSGSPQSMTYNNFGIQGNDKVMKPFVQPEAPTTNPLGTEMSLNPGQQSLGLKADPINAWSTPDNWSKGVAAPVTKTPTDWGKVGTMAGQIAPMIYNMAMGLKKPDKVRPNYNPYEGQIRSLMANRRFNIDPLLTANRTANAVVNRNVRNTGNSRGEMMGNYGANQNYRMQADAAAWAQKNNMDNQYMGQQAEMDAQLGQQRAGMDWNTQMGNAGNKAATQQFMTQGFNDLGRFAQTQQLMNNQMKNSQYLGGIYQDVYGGLSNWTANINKILNSLPKTNINGK
jgi:hypothetical protein